MIDHPPGETQVPSVPRRPGGTLVFTGVGLVVVSFLLQGALSWTGFREGAENGVTMIVFVGWMVLPVVVVLGTVAHFLYRRSRLGPKGYALVVLAPALLVSIFVLSPLVHWPFHKHRFRTFVADPIPASVHDIRSYFGGGRDIECVVFFQLDPADFAKVIESGGYQFLGPVDGDHFFDLALRDKLQRHGLPDTRKWGEAEKYLHKSTRANTQMLFVTRDHTKACMVYRRW